MAEYIDRTQLTLTPIDITDLPEDKALLVYEKEGVEGLPTADVIEREKINKAIEEIENEIKFWDEEPTYPKPYTIEIRKRKADSYRHALEILKGNIGE